MPYTVKEITRGLAPPIVAYPYEKIYDALNRMLKHGFSQLPVVIQEESVHTEYFLITKDSILVTLGSLGLSTQNQSLHVFDAKVPVKKYYENDELFDLISGVKEHGAALIIGNDNNLLNIVTTHDATAYLMQISEDILHVRDVEHTIKDYIIESFKKPDGSINEIHLHDVVIEVMGIEKEWKYRFEKAIKKYLNKTMHNLNNSKKPFIPNPDDIEDAFDEIRKGLGKEKGFSELTLDGYIRLFFHDKCWGRFGHVFGIDKEVFRFLLEGVRETRNKLAHFHEDEITPQQREQLLRCERWLGDYKKIAFKELNSIQEI